MIGHFHYTYSQNLPPNFSIASFSTHHTYSLIIRQNNSKRHLTLTCPPFSLFTLFHISPRGISHQHPNYTLPVYAYCQYRTSSPVQENHFLHPRQRPQGRHCRSPAAAAALSSRFNDVPTGGPADAGVLRRCRRGASRDVLRVPELVGAAGWSRWLLSTGSVWRLLILIFVCCFF